MKVSNFVCSALGNAHYKRQKAESLRESAMNINIYTIRDLHIRKKKRKVLSLKRVKSMICIAKNGKLKGK